MASSSKDYNLGKPIKEELVRYDSFNESAGDDAGGQLLYGDGSYRAKDYSDLGGVAPVTQIVTKPIREEKGKDPEDEEAVEVGVISITGYQVNILRNVIFHVVFFAIMTILGYIAWVWPGGVFSEDSSRCESKLGIPTGDCLSYQVGFFLAVFFIFAGLEVLWFKWYPAQYVKFRSEKVPLDLCSVVVIETYDGGSHPADVKRVLDVRGVMQRTFEFRHCNFVWRDSVRKFLVEVPDMGPPVLREKGKAFGLTDEQVDKRVDWYGHNLIDVPLPSTPVLLMQEILHPFLWFQLFSIIVWCMENYYIYSMIIALMTLISAFLSLKETKDTITSIRDMSRFICTVVVVRDGQEKEVSSCDIAAGDIVVIQNETTLAFDAVLLSGEAIVNESMLTGESVPVIKLAYDSKSLSVADIPKSSILYNGTLCVQAKPNIHSEYPKRTLAKVWKTGFSTSKGRLVRSILFPRPTKFSLYQDGFRFIGIMAGLALVGFAISIYFYVINGVRTAQIILYGLDMVTTVVPPALPTTLLTGIALAIGRLKKRRIFCISPPRINVAGKVGLMCFDKTGTLTEEGLDLQMIIPVHKAKFLERVVAAAIGDINREGGDGLEELITVCATCHALRYLTSSKSDYLSYEDGKEKRDLVGDPLEAKMFLATGWTMSESHETTDRKTGEAFAFAVHPPPKSVGNLHEMRVVRAYEFSSTLQRMSVVARDTKDNSLIVMTKGAPEVIGTLCSPNTVPKDLGDTLKSYAKQGYRVLACASRQIASDTDILSLNQVEAEGKSALTFHGLIIMENKLKPQSAPTLQILHEAAIGMVIVTGDHALTAIHVARTVGVIPSIGDVLIGDTDAKGQVVWKDEVNDEILTDEQLRHANLVPDNERQLPNVAIMDESARNKSATSLVLTGRAFEVLCNESLRHPMKELYLKLLLENVVVAARFSPTQKQKLVDLYAEIGHVVGFCGDGANDCGALKSADCGLSLSPQAEASVAAPFTSQITDVSSVVTLLQEGRCALTTSFQLFKFMALYALIEGAYNLQTYMIYCYLGDYVYLLDDLIIVLPLAATMSNTEAYEGLDKKRPITALMSFPVLSSIFGQLILCIIFQIIGRQVVKSRDWFEPQGYQQDDGMSDDEVYYLPGFEPTSILLVANFQFIWMAIVFTISKPFRKNFYTNVAYAADLAICFAICCAVLFADNAEWLNDLLKMIEIPEYSFRWMLFAVVMTNLVVSYLYEQFLKMLIERNKKWQV